MSQFEFVVIGAGIVGSFTALQLAKKGHEVLLIEQFNLPHTRGSSHGQSRMIRSCYEKRFFASLMPDALASWQELEAETNTRLIMRSGVLCITHPDGEESGEQIRKNMKEFCPKAIGEISYEKFVSFYPTLKFSEDHEIFMDKTGGVILAHKALTTVQNLYKSYGGKLWDSCQVLSIIPGEEVSIDTTHLMVKTKSLIVCAGAWTSEIFRDHARAKEELAPYLTPAAVKVFYWKEKDPQIFSQSKRYAPFIDCSNSSHFYGLGSEEYPGLIKICKHGGVPCKPDERDRADFGTEFEGSTREYIKEHLPSLEEEPAVVETCMYTLTPDEVFIVDTLPGEDNIFIGCGFSGTGFKTSPVIGKLLSEMALGEELSHDISNFRLERFQKSK